VIDAEGKYLMPGLSEMHAHVPGGGAEPQYREDVMFLYLANGITLARSMLGHPDHLPLRQRLAVGEVDGPRLLSSGPGLSGNRVPNPEAGIREVREQAEAGYDLIKVFWGPSRETFDAFAEAADAANIPFAGHVPGDVGVERALEAGYASIDHLDAYMPALVDADETEGISTDFFGWRLGPYVQQEKIEELAEKTKEAGVWNVPTESIFRSRITVDLDTLLTERPEFRYMPQDVIDGWLNSVRGAREADDYDEEAAHAFIQARRDLLRALHEAGAGILLGSDAPQWFNVPGFSIHHEMRYMAESGLSPYEILKTGTVNPAKYLNEEDVFGQVKEGLKADLILLEANPLEDLENVRELAGVVRHGRWISRESIDERLEEIAQRNAP